ncbi:MAG TPA: hypothetical protein VJ732_02700, partial [Bryobacteraceae bacterium]|nr:hypothetical protein [Bryobacteraceae bacterium]
ANRLNAQKSTGPRTPEGKAISSMNALKSGLDAESQFVYGEEREDCAQLQQEYFERFRPATPEERFYVDTLIRNEWMLRRLFRAEAHLWEYYVTRADRSEGTPLGEAFATASVVFMRLQRRLSTIEKSYKDAYDELTRLQAARQPKETTPETPEMGSFLQSALADLRSVAFPDSPPENANANPSSPGNASPPNGSPPAA